VKDEQRIVGQCSKYGSAAAGVPHMHHAPSKQAAAEAEAATACPACATCAFPARPPRHVASYDVEQYSLRYIVGVVTRGDFVGPHQRCPAVQRLQSVCGWVGGWGGGGGGAELGSARFPKGPGGCLQRKSEQPTALQSD
jgi:hypothetical protein